LGYNSTISGDKILVLHFQGTFDNFIENKIGISLCFTLATAKQCLWRWSNRPVSKFG